MFGRMARWGLCLGATAVTIAVAACDAGKARRSNLIGADGSGGGLANGGSGNTNTGANTGFGGGFDPGGGGNNGGTVCNSPGGNADFDNDGYSANQGDCNDCDPNVNPAAVEVAGGGGGPPVDENCNGQTDEAEVLCDTGFAIDDPDPVHAAQALDVCATVAQDHYGLVSAKWVRANGVQTSSNVQNGNLPSFGAVQPRSGSHMVGLSSGAARAPGQTGVCTSYLCDHLVDGTAPNGFPQDNPSCAGALDIHDDAALELTLKAPSNATGYSYEFTFYSFEYPEWVCTSFNDQYIALVSPPPQGSIQGNISFDGNHNPISVNVAFFNVCPNCPLSTGELVGTGFDGSLGDDGGATGWLVTTAPVGGGDQFTIRFAIWDTGDGVWDSTTLLDHFQWIANGGTVSVGTIPVPN